MTIDSKDSRYYDNIDLGFTYTKKGEEPVPCYSFPVYRPSHCPFCRNEQRQYNVKSHATFKMTIKRA